MLAQQHAAPYNLPVDGQAEGERGRAQYEKGRKMNPKILLTVFATVFLAELADKTQIATLLFSADKQINKLGVFVAAASALVLSTAIAVVVGGTASHLLNKRVLSIIAGVGFIVIGIWNVVQGIKMPE